MSEIERYGGEPSSPFEGRYGFSRVVVVGGFVMIGGTTSIGPSGVVCGQGEYEQSVEILGRLQAELARVGAALGDVVSTRVYVTDIARADDVGRAFGEVFREVRPLMTMVEVSALIDPRMLVEIELVAWRG